VASAFGADDAAGRLRSILAVHEGAIVYERYHPLDPPDTILNSFSVAKSFTSAVVGLLVDDGVLDPAAPAPVPEWEGDDRADITLEHLLQMRSGLFWEEVYGEGGTLGTMLTSPDWAGWAIEQELEAEPGERFEYSTGTTAVLAEIVADQVGGPDALEEFMWTELLDPLGIQSTTFVEDSTGQFAGGLGFDSTIRDFARFGYLFLRGGEWDGDQILSTEWVDYSATPSPGLDVYGAQWWLDGPDGNLIAKGLFGQYILVVPDRDLVIAANATQGGDSWTPLVTLYEQFAG
jgi:CubicO group peptidase (beta-lactamase class C family)